MKITFGMYLDGAEWSDAEASIGEARLGPAGMLELLETRLGLTRPTIHPAYRINETMQRLQACDSEKAWFHDSYDADPWSTAKQMLAWRDELAEVGWTGETIPDASPRLAALTALENSGIALSAGRADRLREVIANLGSGTPLGIETVKLVEPLDILPPVWRLVFELLAKAGVAVEESSVDTIDKWPEVTLATGSDEWEAAESMALWLAAGKDKNKDVTIICGGDSDILDQALRRQGLPELGRAEATRWRAYLQVLPLVIANMWQPVEIPRLVELLTIPRSPINRFAAKYLLDAINKEPGVGGGAWKVALQTIKVKREEKNVEDGRPNPKKESEEFVTRLDKFLATDRYDAETGVPEEVLIERCQWVAEWLGKFIGTDKALAEAIGQARDMQLIAKGRGLLPRVTVERMLDSVIDIGSSDPERSEQAAPWVAVNEPGQIATPRESVLWWGFTNESVSGGTFWSEQERSGLAALGCELEDSVAKRAREALAWRSAARNATKQLLIFHPENICGEPTGFHPFWDEIFIAKKKELGLSDKELEEALIKRCLDLQKMDKWALAGRKADLEETNQLPIEPIDSTHRIPKGLVSTPDHLSYSQMGSMISCPMQWALDRNAKLRSVDAENPPSGDLMIGNMCHRIIEELYTKPGDSWEPAVAEARALALYDAFVPSMASELLLPENKLENLWYRKSIGRAIRQFTEAIKKYGLIVGQSEIVLEGELDGIPFTGRADLLLSDKSGNKFIVDFKWAKSKKYKEADIKEGKALQLAAYAWLIRASGETEFAHGGYFMLNQGVLLSDSKLLGDDALSSARTSEETWDLGVKTWGALYGALNEGHIEAAGVAEMLLLDGSSKEVEKAAEVRQAERESAGLMYLRPFCAYCDFPVLCGRARGGR